MKIKSLLSGLLIGLLFFDASVLHAGRKVKIGIITLLNDSKFLKVASVFEASIKERGYDADFKYFNADYEKYPKRFKQRAIDSYKEMEAEDYDLVFMAALYFFPEVAKAIGKTPVVDGWHYVSRYDSRELYQTKNDNIYAKGNSTGAVYAYAFEEVCEFIKISVPGAKNVAFIHMNDAHHDDIAKSFGLNLISIEFNGPDDVKAALEKAKKTSDIAFASNEIIMVGKGEETIAFMLENNYPVIMSTVRMLQMGALASFDKDPVEIGEICAQKADLILKGQKANEIPIVIPEKYEIGINLKTANKIHFLISPSFIQIATTVIR